jgi:hypothetical protein
LLVLLVSYGAGISFSGNLGKGLSKNALFLGIAILLVVYRHQVRDLVAVLIARIGSGSVDIHIGSMQFKVDEGAVADFGTMALPFLRPLELAPPSTGEESDGEVVIGPEKKLGVTRGPA